MGDVSDDFQEVYFDKKQTLVIVNIKGQKCYYVIPPTDVPRVDLLSFDGITGIDIDGGYQYKYNGFVIVTTDTERYVMDNKGRILDKINFFN